MKRLFGWALLMMCFMSVAAQAQQENSEAEPVTDEEIEKFASMKDSVNHFMEVKQADLESMIKDNEVFDVARYNEIKEAWGDDAKLAEINITDEEKAEYEEILNTKNSLSDVIKERMIELIKNDEVLGAATYNKVNAAMKTDPEVKAKVDELIAEKASARAPEEEEDGE
ncbi:hypothetical protein [Echinicola vietnamensis]|uniref:DUF4168 domain-containing protein n=1 Tax=Echinicola vietnamensis (strain DSM 17526 / LMG 23754 / KMM 6221) TaxID=926556 RepID=L0G4N3_ECHVK|nr:hypothetical protein [Echinicola vietnamensis]AGA79790.1 hypothetical protein Echvi_3574 [Echinicola vietnamensis DSM 17526]